MNNQSVSYIAIDIAKDTLRVQTDRAGLDFLNTASGVAMLVRKMKSLSNRHFICEATGGYERLLMEFLYDKGERVSLVSPARVRDFARSEGIKAKTDPIDAHMIMRFAKEKNPCPTPPPSPERRSLIALLDRREHLSEQIKREKTRLPKSSEIVRESIQSMIDFIQNEINQIDERIATLIAGNETLSKADELLREIKGVGPVTSWAILGYLPEITKRSRNEIVALVGVAPFNRDSGNKDGKRRIFGGRSKLRRTLYMATTVAAQHNEVIKPYVQELEKRGKPYKCAIVAAMRKMIIHAQSILKKHEISLA